MTASTGASSRRGFLKVALLAGGGLAIGVLLPGCHGYDAATAAKADKTGDFSPNVWLRIHPDDRVVFVLDRVEMGQGTMTSQTTLLAEELEIDPRKIHIELAPANRVYAQPDAGFQITGGSSSVKGAWEPLRHAGAVAREMLRAGAASTWGVPVAECRCDDGAVVHTPTGKRGTYGSFTRAAAHMPVPDPALKPPSSFKWIGKSLERFDGRMKVDGTGVYGIDVKVPGALTAVVLRCPVFGGKLAGFDAASAKASPGIVDVFEIPSGVAVVAPSFWRAKKAAELVTVRWDEGALADLDSAKIRAKYEELGRAAAKSVRDDGHFDRAMQGHKTVEGVYDVPFLAHATMEPQNCTASVTEGRCEIWAPTQSPAMAHEQARNILGIAESQITVHQTLLGGGFGRRLGDDFVAEAIHMSHHLRRPVKVVWTREDDMHHDFYRPATHNVLRGAVGPDGKIVGWFHRIVAQSIIAQAMKVWTPVLIGGAPQALKPFLTRTASHLYESKIAPDPTATENAADFAYKIPNLRVEYAQVEPVVPVGFWRSVGSSENAFIVESFVDELAHLAGRDPVDVRRELLHGLPRHLGVLERAVKEAGWGAPLPAGRSRGFALCKSFETYCAQVAEVSVEGGRIRVHRVVAAIDCGIVVNPDLVRAQVESAIVFGLSAALYQKITLSRGRVDQSNFHDYKMMRMHEAPAIEVHLVKSDEKPTGVGEPGLPPIAPAVANAVFAATGKRLRALPLSLA